MTKAFHPSTVSANDLRSGISVWLTPNMVWSANATDAKVFDDAKTANTALTQAEAQSSFIVGAFLAPTIKNGRSGTLRESIRQSGPTIQLQPLGT